MAPTGVLATTKLTTPQSQNQATVCVWTLLPTRLRKCSPMRRAKPQRAHAAVIIDMPMMSSMSLST